MKNDHFAAQLSAAFGQHQAGDLESAEEGYRELLGINANNFDVLHLLGLICFQTGRYEEADALMSKALVYNPGSGDASSNHGLVLLKLGRPEAALKRFSVAVKVAPKSSAASANYALALLELGRVEDALAWSDKSLKKFPSSDAAERNAGAALLRLQRPEEALMRYQRAFEHRPDDPQTRLGLAACYMALDRSEQAAHFLADVLAADSHNVDALALQAASLEESEDYEGALRALDSAIAQVPALIRLRSARARVLGKLERHVEVLAACDELLALDAQHLDAWFYRGVARQAQGDFEGALEEYSRVLDIEPMNASAQWNQAYCQLTLGRLGVGFQGYEWRLKNAYLGHPERKLDAPLWLGQFAIEGKRILLHSEQGFGDTFMFLRYVALVKQQGAEVVLEVPRAVHALVKEWVGEDDLLGIGEAAQKIDAHCPLASLPLALGTDENSIPADVPYLSSDAEHTEKWSLILGPKPLLRIGIAWSGNKSHVNDRNRSIALSEFLRAFPKEAQLVALQIEVRKDDQRALEQEPRLSFHGAQIRDFADTAALIDLVDLVVCIDTGVAHLSAAMNKPTWILLDTISDWRWQLNRTDSPWYPSVRLWRQSTSQEWASVLARILKELEERVPKKRGLLGLFRR